MIEAVEFKNFRALRDANLPLGRCTVILGPNGSGKSTAIRALELVSNAAQAFSGPAGQITLAKQEHRPGAHRSAGTSPGDEVEIRVVWGPPSGGEDIRYQLGEPGRRLIRWNPDLRVDHAKDDPPGVGKIVDARHDTLDRVRVYSLDAQVIAQPAKWQPGIAISEKGGNLGVVLSELQDQHIERFDAINAEISRWLPEFDRVVLDTLQSEEVHRTFGLRLRAERQPIWAGDLSQGILLALCMLTMAYLPDPPTVVCLEEPDRGIHPRLLREVRDALYRLAYPESVKENRPPVQVIVTTHSPYLLDLFREHPEEIVLADKDEKGVHFQQLSKIDHVEEILQDAQLSEAWYTGVLGGVPAAP